MDRNREDRVWCDGPDVGLSSANWDDRMVDGTDALGEDVQVGAGGHCHVLAGIREDRRISAGRPVGSVRDL